MAISTYKPGPGTLTIGAGPLDASAQVTSCAVEPEENVETEDAVDVLSGETLPEEETATYKYKLTASFLQDALTAGGLVEYTWDHAGETVPFDYAPNDALAQKITGNLRVIPLKVGGDIKKRATADWSVKIIGTPALVANV